MADGPVVVITAAGRGLGAACARELAGRGYRVVGMSPSGSARRLAEELGGAGLDGSVTEGADIEALVGLALDRYARIDAVFANTGFGPGTIRERAPGAHSAFTWDPGLEGHLLDLADDDWHLGLDMYLLHAIRLARLVTPVMVERGTGAIVNMSSMMAFEPRPSWPTAILRSSLQAFTKLYADRYAANGIRMNCIAPGWIENHDAAPGDRRRVPLQRAGTLAEVAKTVAFLLSPDAGYITGQHIVVDGGLNRSMG